MLNLNLKLKFKIQVFEGLKNLVTGLFSLKFSFHRNILNAITYFFTGF